LRVCLYGLAAARSCGCCQLSCDCALSRDTPPPPPRPPPLCPSGPQDQEGHHHPQGQPFLPQGPPHAPRARRRQRRPADGIIFCHPRRRRGRHRRAKGRGGATEGGRFFQRTQPHPRDMQPRQSQPLLTAPPLACANRQARAPAAGGRRPLRPHVRCRRDGLHRPRQRALSEARPRAPQREDGAQVARAGGAGTRPPPSPFRPCDATRLRTFMLRRRHYSLARFCHQCISTEPALGSQQDVKAGGQRSKGHPLPLPPPPCPSPLSTAIASDTTFPRPLFAPPPHTHPPRSPPSPAPAQTMSSPSSPPAPRPLVSGAAGRARGAEEGVAPQAAPQLAVSN
jgi:hypothetical protein